MIGEYTQWFENLDIYQEWMRKLPEPLNNVAFASAVFLAALVFLVSAVVNRILLIRWNAAQRKARRQREEERLQEQEENRKRERQKREDRELVEMYLRFLVTAQMQNFTSLQGITFEQWKAQMTAEAAADRKVLAEAGAEKVTAEAETAKEITAEMEAVTEKEAVAETIDVAGVEIQETAESPETTEDGRTAETGQERETEVSESVPVETMTGMIVEERLPGKMQNETNPGNRNRFELGIGFTAEEDGETEWFSGELCLPEVHVSAEEPEEERDPVGTVLQGIDLAAVLDRIGQGSDADGAVEELSSEQQSDFVKVLARMREDAEKQEGMEQFRREKSEIIKNNLSALDRSLSAHSLPETDGVNGERKKHADDEMERRKAAAREALREAERLEQVKKERRSRFRKKK